MAEGLVRVVSFEETKDSRDGSARGVSGINEMRKFMMILDIPDGQFTEARYPDVRGLAGEQIPLGTPHPWNAFSFAADWLALTRESARRWLIGVVYKPSHGASDMPLTPAGTPWRVRVRGVSFPFELRETYPVGDPPTTKLIATSQFEEVDVTPPSAPNFTATVFRYNSARPPKLVPATINLAKTAMLNPQPQIDDSGGLGATWTRTIKDFDFDNMGRINAILRSINAKNFLGAPPGHVRFDTFSLEPIDAFAPGLGNPGQHYRVSIGFVMSVVPYTPIGLHPTFRDKEGNETPVMIPAQVLRLPGSGPTELLVETFNVKRLKNFSPLFQIFGALPI